MCERIIESLEPFEYQTSTLVSGTSLIPDIFSCAQCDKIFTNAQGLEVKSVLLL